MKIIFPFLVVILLFITCKRDKPVITKAAPATPTTTNDKIVFIKELKLNPYPSNTNCVVAANSQFLVLNTEWHSNGMAYKFITNKFYDEFYTEVCSFWWEQFYMGRTASACECNGNIFCYLTNNGVSYIVSIRSCGWGRTLAFIRDTPLTNGGRIDFLKITQKGSLVFEDHDSLFCMDSLGTIKWKIRSAPLNLTALRDVCETTSGDILLLGEKQSASTDRDFCLTRFDRNGIMIWQKLYGGQYYDEAQQVLYNNDQEIFLIGHSNSFTNNGTHDAFIIHINSDGDTLKQKTFGGMFHDVLQCGKFYKDKLVVTGYHDPDGSGKEVVFVTLLDKNLNLLQQADAPFTTNQQPTSCALINKTFAVCGDGFLMRFTLPD